MSTDWVDAAAAEIAAIGGPVGTATACAIIRRHEALRPWRARTTGRRPLTLRDFETETDGPMLSPEQVSEVLFVSDDIVRLLADSGAIRAVRLGKVYRIVWTSVRNYLVRCHVLPLPAAELLGPPPRRLGPADLEAMPPAALKQEIGVRRLSLAAYAGTAYHAVLAREIVALREELKGRLSA